MTQDGVKPGEFITSRHNSKIQWLRSLKDRKTRHGENVVVLEGLRLVEDVLSLGDIQPRLVVYSDRLLENPRGQRLAEMLAARWPAACAKASDAVLDASAETATPQGVIAVVPAPWREWALYLGGGAGRAADRERVRGKRAGVGAAGILALDAVGDPGNVGTAIRSACGAGLDGVLVGPGCADPGAGKAVRASMGALFRVPVFPVSDLGEAIRKGRRAGFKTVGATAPDTLTATVTVAAAAAPGGATAVPAVPLWEADFAGRTIIVVGSEAAGISRDVAAEIEAAVTIPLARGLESLNAGVAASILAFEFARHSRGEHGKVGR